MCAHHETTAQEDMEEFSDLYDLHDGLDFCWPIVHLTEWQPDSLRG